ncbi:hypothetical protein [Nocardia sp. NPDC050717]|uniref:DUF6973 domain-containing protein n=1 Tax=Nocardia sp. NPDC050717 TaxID=3157221 RepID=UPI0033F2B0B2
MTEEQITISQIMGWNLAPASGLPGALTGAATQIEQNIEAANRSVQESGPYFEGAAGDALRTTFGDDRKDCLITVDILNDLSVQVAGVTSVFLAAQDELKDIIGDIEDSDYDLFHTDDGDVESRKSNWELLFFQGPGAVAAKTVAAQYYQSKLRIVTSRVIEADQMMQAEMSRLLERLPESVRTALVSKPTDPTLAGIMSEYQVDGSDEMVVFPSGALLEALRTVDPSIEPKAMSAGEAAALAALSSQPGGLMNLKTFYDIQAEATAAAETAYENDPRALNDGHGDAYRHMYWNARMTQEFGSEWTSSFASAHEQVGGNPAAREAMDLYNNKLGRTIGTENMNASPAELGSAVQAAIDDNKAIVLVGPDDNAQIGFSNSVQVGGTAWQPGAEVPAPKGK